MHYGYINLNLTQLPNISASKNLIRGEVYYMRLMIFSLTIEDWPRAINELIQVCKPGGSIEIMERDILWYNETDLVCNWRTKSK